MIKGYLAMKGVYAAETRIGSVLKSSHQPYHEARRQGARNLNPIPYQADYMGHKIHIDQKEKLTSGIWYARSVALRCQYKLFYFLSDLSNPCRIFIFSAVSKKNIGHKLQKQGF
ncbi:hypothetical protein QQF64_018582 [Cirrhinus molitorella]|uniref:Uncharacterized protein n=1 Tax=Cirrhinus molitorella TaxID=172907 RepID=A0ABR3LFE4_9TELE